MTPCCPTSGNSRRGASGTPSLSLSNAVAVSSSLTHPHYRSAPPSLQLYSQSSARRQPLPAPPPAGGVSAYSPRSTRFSSGNTCDTFASLPTTERACLHLTRPDSIASARISAMAASSSSRFSCRTSQARFLPAKFYAQRHHRIDDHQLTTSLAGAACSSSSRSPSTASCACTCARVPAGAGMPPAATVCSTSMIIPATFAGVCTTLSSATPIKLSTHTCRYDGATWWAPGGIRPARCAPRRRSDQRRTIAGGGCCASKAACLRWTHAATISSISARIYSGRRRRRRLAADQ
eukprot:2118942-Pleurochrysis_carterae.AAC.3